MKSATPSAVRGLLAKGGEVVADELVREPEPAGAKFRHDGAHGGHSAQPLRTCEHAECADHDEAAKLSDRTPTALIDEDCLST